MFSAFQVRYQQKQREEIERKRSELAGLSATSAIDLNENNKIHIGNGKVYSPKRLTPSRTFYHIFQIFLRRYRIYVLKILYASL